MNLKSKGRESEHGVGGYNSKVHFCLGRVRKRKESEMP
jgi:hypothetical protein